MPSIHEALGLLLGTAQTNQVQEHIPATGRQRQKDEKPKVILGYVKLEVNSGYIKPEGVKVKDGA